MHTHLIPKQNKIVASIFTASVTCFANNKRSFYLTYHSNGIYGDIEPMLISIELNISLFSCRFISIRLKLGIQSE